MRSVQLGRFVCVCLLCIGVAFAQDADPQTSNVGSQIEALPWVEGPTQVTVGSHATFQVPSGYRFLGPSGTLKFMELTHNLPPSDGTTVFAPDDFHWFGAFQYDDVGHVPDDDSIDPDALLKTMRKNQVQANKELAARGWTTFEIAGWKYAPFYDSATHNLSWATDLRTDSGHETINYNARLLGRTGYTAATLVASPDGLDAAVAEFKGAISGYAYIPDQTYAAFKPGEPPRVSRRLFGVSHAALGNAAVCR